MTEPGSGNFHCPADADPVGTKFSVEHPDFHRDITKTRQQQAMNLIHTPDSAGGWLVLDPEIRVWLGVCDPGHGSFFCFLVWPLPLLGR